MLSIRSRLCFVFSAEEFSAILPSGVQHKIIIKKNTIESTELCYQGMNSIISALTVNCWRSAGSLYHMLIYRAEQSSLQLQLYTCKHMKNLICAQVVPFFFIADIFYFILFLSVSTALFCTSSLEGSLSNLLCHSTIIPSLWKLFFFFSLSHPTQEALPSNGNQKSLWVNTYAKGAAECLHMWVLCVWYLAQSTVDWFVLLLLV